MGLFQNDFMKLQSTMDVMNMHKVHLVLHFLYILDNLYFRKYESQSGATLSFEWLKYLTGGLKSLLNSEM